MSRILIVDDHAVVRDGVKRILEEQDGPTTFGEAESTEEALDAAHREEWDLVVLDLSLAGQSGLDVLKRLKELRPRVPVLILSMHSEQQYARRAFKAGAAGYLTKGSPRTELVKAVNTLLRGGRYISPALAEVLITALEQGGQEPNHSSLSDREFEVLRLIAAGNTVTEIAAQLRLSDKTVSTYRARVLEKLRLKSTAELIRYAVRHELVT